MEFLSDFWNCISSGGIPQLLQQLINGIAKGSIYSLIALGYTMVYGIVELINFAHGDIFMLGSFIALSLFTAIGVTGIVAGGVFQVIGILLLIFLLTMLITGAWGSSLSASHINHCGTPRRSLRLFQPSVCRSSFRTSVRSGADLHPFPFPVFSETSSSGSNG